MSTGRKNGLMWTTHTLPSTLAVPLLVFPLAWTLHHLRLPSSHTSLPFAILSRKCQVPLPPPSTSKEGSATPPPYFLTPCVLLWAMTLKNKWVIHSPCIRWNVPLLILLYLNTWYQVYSTRYICIFRGIRPWRLTTTTLTLTRRLWGDLCLDALACEGSRLIRPKGDAVDGGCAFQNLRTSSCRWVLLIRTTSVSIQTSSVITECGLYETQKTGFMDWIRRTEANEMSTHRVRKITTKGSQTR